MSTNRRRELMTARDRALAAGDIATFQKLTKQIAVLPLKGVRRLTAQDIARYVGRKQR
jgi:hypothetical protein